MAQKKRLGELLSEAGLLNQEQLEHALKNKKGLKLGEYLANQGLVRERDIIDAIASQLKIQKYSPSAFPIKMDLVDLIPADLAQKYKVVPLKVHGSLLMLGMVDPMDLDAMDAIEIYANKEVEAVICSQIDYAHIVSSLYGSRQDLDNMMDNFEDSEDELDVATDKNSEDDVSISSLQGIAEEAPIIRLVNSILAQAVKEKASDVHISPEKDYVQVRFRIDGKLQEVPSPPKSMFLAIASRLKILGNMDIASSRVPQDGRFTIKMEGREINVRVSSLPTIYGENLVLRLLDMSSGGYTLDELGIGLQSQQLIEQAIHKPYGMILTTGPTGSGKSTTLYSVLKKLNSPEINIITLEDPVEYRIGKIRQVQLNTKAGMTFASGLRSILRQDPDVVMVGEIRDYETANISVQAALTGHRLLSTVHTNDAAGAITRFVEMGIEPFLISSVLLVSIAQRLIRRNCSHCSEPYQPDRHALRFWGLDKVSDAQFMRGKGCINCNFTGYKGRVGLYEVLLNDEMIQEMTIRRASSQEITIAAQKAGTLRTLKEDAMDKVLAGMTTLEEATSSVMT